MNEILACEVVTLHNDLALKDKKMNGLNKSEYAKLRCTNLEIEKFQQNNS